MKLYSVEMSLVELTKIYNSIKGVKPIKKFSGSKAEAIARIDAAFAAQPKAAKNTLNVVAVIDNRKKKATTATSAKGASTAGPRTGVCAWMAAQYHAGVSAKDTFEKLHSHFPTAKTTLKTVRWYFAFLNNQES